MTNHTFTGRQVRALFPDIKKRRWRKKTGVPPTPLLQLTHLHLEKCAFEHHVTDGVDTIYNAAHFMLELVLFHISAEPFARLTQATPKALYDSDFAAELYRKVYTQTNGASWPFQKLRVFYLSGTHMNVFPTNLLYIPLVPGKSLDDLYGIYNHIVKNLPKVGSFAQTKEYREIEHNDRKAKLKSFSDSPIHYGTDLAHHRIKPFANYANLYPKLSYITLMPSQGLAKDSKSLRHIPSILDLWREKARRQAMEPWNTYEELERTVDCLDFYNSLMRHPQLGRHLPTVLGYLNGHFVRPWRLVHSQLDIIDLFMGESFDKIDVTRDSLVMNNLFTLPSHCRPLNTIMIGSESAARLAAYTRIFTLFTSMEVDEIIRNGGVEDEIIDSFGAGRSPHDGRGLCMLPPNDLNAFPNNTYLINIQAIRSLDRPLNLKSWNKWSQQQQGSGRDMQKRITSAEFDETVETTTYYVETRQEMSLGMLMSIDINVNVMTHLEITDILPRSSSLHQIVLGILELPNLSFLSLIMKRDANMYYFPTQDITQDTINLRQKAAIETRGIRLSLDYFFNPRRKLRRWKQTHEANDFWPLQELRYLRLAGMGLDTFPEALLPTIVTHSSGSAIDGLEELYLLNHYPGVAKHGITYLDDLPLGRGHVTGRIFHRRLDWFDPVIYPNLVKTHSTVAGRTVEKISIVVDNRLYKNFFGMPQLRYVNYRTEGYTNRNDDAELNPHNNRAPIKNRFQEVNLAYIREKREESGYVGSFKISRSDRKMLKDSAAKTRNLTLRLELWPNLNHVDLHGNNLMKTHDVKQIPLSRPKEQRGRETDQFATRQQPTTKDALVARKLASARIHWLWRWMDRGIRATDFKYPGIRWKSLSLGLQDLGHTPKYSFGDKVNEREFVWNFTQDIDDITIPMVWSHTTLELKGNPMNLEEWSLTELLAMSDLRIRQYCSHISHGRIRTRDIASPKQWVKHAGLPRELVRGQIDALRAGYPVGRNRSLTFLETQVFDLVGQKKILKYIEKIIGKGYHFNIDSSSQDTPGWEGRGIYISHDNDLPLSSVIAVMCSIDSRLGIDDNFTSSRLTMYGMGRTKENAYGILIPRIIHRIPGESKKTKLRYTYPPVTNLETLTTFPRTTYVTNTNQIPNFNNRDWVVYQDPEEEEEEEEEEESFLIPVAPQKEFTVFQDPEKEEEEEKEEEFTFSPDLPDLEDVINDGDDDDQTELPSLQDFTTPSALEKGKEKGDDDDNIIQNIYVRKNQELGSPDDEIFILQTQPPLPQEESSSSSMTDLLYKSPQYDQTDYLEDKKYVEEKKSMDPHRYMKYQRFLDWSDWSDNKERDAYDMKAFQIWMNHNNKRYANSKKYEKSYQDRRQGSYRWLF